MPGGFFHYIHLGRSRTDDENEHHNLQEGLFQIASQTCNILVQVNNTNNINFGTNVHYNNYTPTSSSTDFSVPSTSLNVSRDASSSLYDLENSVVLLQPKQSRDPAAPSKGRFQRLSQYRRRLSVSWVNIIHQIYLFIFAS